MIQPLIKWPVMPQCYTILWQAAVTARGTTEGPLAARTEGRDEVC